MMLIAGTIFVVLSQSPLLASAPWFVKSLALLLGIVCVSNKIAELEIISFVHALMLAVEESAKAVKQRIKEEEENDEAS